MKQSRHLQGLVSITTSQTFSLPGDFGYKQKHSLNIFSSQILVPYLYSCFLCLLKMIPSPYNMYNCPVELQTDS